MVALFGLAFLGWAVSHTSAADQDEVVITYEVDNLSPTIIYDPPLIGEPIAGAKASQPNRAKNAWNTSFYNHEYYKGEIMRFDQPHYAWATFQEGMPPPTAQLSFVGREVAIVGPKPESKPDLGTGTVQLELDGQPVGECSEQGGSVRVRCNYTASEFRRHTFTVKVTAGTFALDHFDVSTGNPEEKEPIVVDCASGNDRFNRGGPYDLTTTGQWGAESKSTNAKDESTVEWTRAVTYDYESTLSINVPKGTSRVSMLGAVDVDHNKLRIAIDPPAFGMSHLDGNAFNLHTVQGFTVFETVLDPDVEHKLTVTNLAPDGYFLDVSQFTFHTKEGYGKGGGLSTGAIVGIAVGCAAAVIIAAVLAWIFFRRRKRQQNADAAPVDMESDGGEVTHTLEPFPQPVTTAQTVEGRSSSDPSRSSMGVPGSGGYPTLSSSHQSSASTSAPLLSPGSQYTPLSLHNPDEHGQLTAGASAQHTAGASTQRSASVSTVGIGALEVKGVQQPPVTVQHVHHTDGGRFSPPAAVSAEVVTEETPPTYDPNWAPASASGGPSASAPSDASYPTRTEKGI